jgi:tRNA(fMet)-specific endonuclease VapC
MYLLDTNIITYLQRGNENVINKITNTFIDELSVCTIVLAECFYGAYHHPTRSKEQIEYYIKYFQNLDVYDFDIKAALEYAKIRNELTKSGKLIADMDLMIASICIANDLVLVTNNTKDFVRIKNLKLEDWTEC